MLGENTTEGDERINVEQEQSLVPDDEVASVLDEVDDKKVEGSAVERIEQDLMLQTISPDMPTTMLAEATVM